MSTQTVFMQGFEQHRIEVNDVEINYVVAGEGVPLLLLLLTRFHTFINIRCLVPWHCTGVIRNTNEALSYRFSRYLDALH